MASFYVAPVLFGILCNFYQILPGTLSDQPSIIPKPLSPEDAFLLEEISVHEALRSIAGKERVAWTFEEQDILQAKKKKRERKDKRKAMARELEQAAWKKETEERENVRKEAQGGDDPDAFLPLGMCSLYADVLQADWAFQISLPLSGDSGRIHAISSVVMAERPAQAFKLIGTFQYHMYVRSFEFNKLVHR